LTHTQQQEHIAAYRALLDSYVRVLVAVLSVAEQPHVLAQLQAPAYLSAPLLRPQGGRSALAAANISTTAAATAAAAGGSGLHCPGARAADSEVGYGCGSVEHDDDEGGGGGDGGGGSDSEGDEGAEANVEICFPAGWPTQRSFRVQSVCLELGFTKVISTATGERLSGDRYVLRVSSARAAQLLPECARAVADAAQGAERTTPAAPTVPGPAPAASVASAAAAAISSTLTAPKPSQGFAPRGPSAPTGKAAGGPTEAPGALQPPVADQKVRFIHL
jgi:hypothetical protein